MTTIKYKCDICEKEIEGKYYLTIRCKWVQRDWVQKIVKDIIVDENIDLCPDCFKNFKKFLHKE